MAELLWRPQARDDLIEIYVFLGLESVEAADRTYELLTTRAEMLRQMPRMGIRRTEIAEAGRVLVEGWYLLLYETLPDTDEGPVSSVEIVRVVDGRRDLRRLF